METQLNNICFFDVRVALVGTLADANIIQTGESSEVLDSLQSLLEGVAQAKSLIAWLREKADKGEAIARDAMAALMLAAIMKKESEED